MAGFYLSPAVYPVEVDASNIIPAVATSIGANVGFSRRGPLDVSLVTQTKQHSDWYGDPNPGEYFHYCNIGFLQFSDSLWAKRVIKNAVFGGVEIKTAASAQSNAAITGVTIADQETWKTTLEANSFGTDGLFQVFPPDPGVWNNDCAVKITNISNTDFEFDVEFYEKDAGGVYQLRFNKRVSRKQKKDGFGRDMYIGDVFAPGNKYFVVIDNTLEADTVLPKEQTTHLAVANGADGDLVTNTEVNAAWDLFRNTSKYEVGILIGGGFTDYAVVNNLLSIAEERRDAFAIVDMPYGKTAQQAVDWRNNDLSGIDSSYIAIYSPWLKVYDSFNDKPLFIPPSGHVAGIYANTDYVADPWFAPAGLNRGKLSVMDLSTSFTKGERDLLYQNQINPIMRHPQGGSVVWGQKTMQKKPSALDRVNVRRLLITIEKAIATALEFFVFEPNDGFTRLFIKNTIDDFLRDVKNRRGLYDYRIVVDETNNTPETIDRNELHTDIYLKPTRAAEYLPLRTIVTKTGASFEELIGGGL